MTSAKKTPNFEQSLNNLEELVAAMESGDLSLEESLATFEKGIKLTRECQQQLNQAAQKVKLLIGDGDDMELKDFDSDHNDTAQAEQ